VNDKPAAFLLDTGADLSIISPQAAGVSSKLDALKPWIDRTVLVMDLSEASKGLGTRIDGYRGQDILREFSAVRIDYKVGLVEFEKEDGAQSQTQDPPTPSLAQPAHKVLGQNRKRHLANLLRT
jgi:hypothetical protein